MTARLTLICHGSTDAVRAAAFPRDESLDHYGETGATELAGRLPNVDFCWTSPELRTPQTAEALGLNASVQPMLRECDYGRWAGRAFGEIVAHEPDAANSWLHDPAAAPHGGEAILGLIRSCRDLARGRASARPTIHHRHPFNNNSSGYRPCHGRVTPVVLAHRYRTVVGHPFERQGDSLERHF